MATVARVTLRVVPVVVNTGPLAIAKAMPVVSLAQSRQGPQNAPGSHWKSRCALDRQVLVQGVKQAMFAQAHGLDCAAYRSQLALAEAAPSYVRDTRRSACQTCLP